MEVGLDEWKDTLDSNVMGFVHAPRSRIVVTGSMTGSALDLSAGASMSYIA